MWLLAAILATAATSVTSISCVKARTRCAYRTGCGAALSNYMYLCSDVLSEPTSVCPKECEHALIALTSTEEGKELMNCDCENDYCEEAKQRIDVCRPQVLKGAANATSSCRLAQLICSADAQCSTALSYYHQLCRSMYRGRKCSKKCLNSIQILRKQEKAAALTACRCDGDEDYDCPRMQNNLARLCFHKYLKNHTRNRDGPGGNRDRSGGNRERPGGNRERPNEPPPRVTSHSSANSIAVSVFLVLMPLFSLMPSR